MPRANRSRKPPDESGSSSEEDPDKDMHSRYVCRRFALIRANYAERPRRPAPRNQNARPGDGHAADAAQRERIRRIKQEIQAGTYVTDAKLKITIDRLLEDLISRQKKQ